jgi:hypothetical protein
MNGIRFTVIFDMDGTFFQTEKILVPYDRLLSAGEGKEKSLLRNHSSRSVATVAEKTREEADKWLLDYNLPFFHLNVVYKFMESVNTAQYETLLRVVFSTLNKGWNKCPFGIR